MAKSRKPERPLRDTKSNRLRRARSVFTAGAPSALGVKPLSLTPQKVTAALRIRPMHLNRNHVVNGGIIMAFADVVGAAGAVLNRPLDRRGGTLESKTNFFSPGRGPKLTAESVPLHIGRTTSVWQTIVRNADGRMVAIVTQTQMSLPRRAEQERTDE
jgi:uncharacterized protein (TIGR00369 family)